MLTKEQKKLAKKELKTWETRVDVMGYFEMPENYKANTETGKYARFTGFLKEWMIEALTSKDSNLSISGDNFPENWWDVAMKIGSGKKIENTLPSLGDIVDDDDKAVVLDTLLPAYRALTEKFEKRSVFQWLFNHSQYTAERDSINALKGVMTSLLNCTPDDINASLAIYKENIPNSGRSQDTRERYSEYYKVQMKIKRYEETEAAKIGKTVEEWRKIQKEELDRIDRMNEKAHLRRNYHKDDVKEYLAAKYDKENGFTDKTIEEYFEEKFRKEEENAKGENVKDENVKGNDIKEPANLDADLFNESIPIYDDDEANEFNKSFIMDESKVLGDNQQIIK